MSNVYIVGVSNVYIVREREQCLYYERESNVYIVRERAMFILLEREQCLCCESEQYLYCTSGGKRHTVCVTFLSIFSPSYVAWFTLALRRCPRLPVMSSSLPAGVHIVFFT